jgi:hypothetical protein
VKKILALLAVFALAAVGCDDKKSSGGTKTNAATGGTYERTVTGRGEAQATVTNTLLEHKATVTDTKTKAVTVTVPGDNPKGGPAIPPGGDGEKKKPGGN